MPDQSRLGFAWRGALSGAVICALLAVAFVFVGVPLLGVVAMLWGNPGQELGQGVLGSLTFAFMAIPVGAAVAVLPSAIIGALGGALVGLLVSLALSAMTARRATLIGACVGLAMAVVVIAAAAPQLSAAAATLTPIAYGVLLGLPAGWLVIGMAIVGRRMARLEKG